MFARDNSPRSEGLESSAAAAAAAASRKRARDASLIYYLGAAAARATRLLGLSVFANYASEGFGRNSDNYSVIGNCGGLLRLVSFTLEVVLARAFYDGSRECQ